MISQIHIKNFKSVVDLTLDLGRVNLFIGENGSGKSNILEAVAFMASTKNSEVDNSTLVSKGVRVTKSELFNSAFTNDVQNIEFNFVVDSNLIETEFVYQEDKWVDIKVAANLNKLFSFVLRCMEYTGNEHFIDSDDNRFKSIKSEDIIPMSKRPYQFYIDRLMESTPLDIVSELKRDGLRSENYFKYSTSEYILKYLIYSPEVSYLRKFEEEGQVRPLGARGEGLFSLIKSLAADNGSLQHIKEHLDVIDWFEDFVIPNDLMSNEYKISIKDRFINSDLKYLDQRSANEGFLFLLFYIVLFSSKKTPQFFAIDNIEASFNPKLCSKLINMLTELAKKNGKQVLMTTHNPATLDGLDLNDPEQRLFVVRRNIDGHTIATRITEKPKITTPMKLSEMWTKGLLGGLPDNF